jgi:transcriptional regulator GlxA family with amidase domain
MDTPTRCAIGRRARRRSSIGCSPHVRPSTARGRPCRGLTPPDILLAQAIREALAESAGAAAPLGALADPQIGAALSLIHQHPDEPWTTTELARRVRLSRSAFCSRFKRLTGEPPVGYLRRTRLGLAATQLEGGDMPLAGIASLVGYGSDVSLSKAFRREFGISPGACRRTAPKRPEIVVSAESADA